MSERILNLTLSITPKAWMESDRRSVWNHHEGMHGINPEEDTRWCVMPCAYGDYIHDCVVISCQSFGLAAYPKGF